MPTRTAAQRRDEAAREYDAFLTSCPAQQLLDRISDKWVTLLGRTLLPLIASIKGWAETNIAEVAAARSQYDEVSASA